jgi:hypothetical protein
MLGERIFLSEGTKERTVVLLCEDRQENETEGSIEIGYAADLDSLASVIERWSRRLWQGTSFEVSPNLALMDGESLKSYNELVSKSSKALGEFCKIRIGLVTGANRFFVLNSDQVEAEGIPVEALSPVIAKFSDSSGLRLTKQDLNRMKRSGKRCLLIDPSQVRKINGNLKKYLDKFPVDQRERNVTFKKRQFWHSANDFLVPDAFLSYMHRSGPGILINTAGLNCTNTIHRVFFKKQVNRIVRQAIAISIHSTFTQLSAEIEGRSYGGGLLKHEPSEAHRIKLILPGLTKKTVEKTFARIDSLVRLGRLDKARKEADRFVLNDCNTSQRSGHVSTLESALREARARRVRSPSTD